MEFWTGERHSIVEGFSVKMRVMLSNPFEHAGDSEEYLHARHKCGGRQTENQHLCCPDQEMPQGDAACLLG
jgi:hypothetical protein